MKLFRYIKNQQLKAGVVLNDKFYDASSFVQDYNEEFFGSEGLKNLAVFIQKNKSQLQQLPGKIIFATPVARPSKIVCIGLNYEDHAKETGAKIPQEPVIFLKSTTALCGPNDDIMIPKNSKKTDWEVELAIVIEKKASYVLENEAINFIAGYCLHNDVSEREFQMERSGTWDKGKGCDTFAPIGPWLVTKDEIENINSLRLWLKVNEEIMQDGTTANLIFKIPFLVSYVSQFMTLLPGDIISTGTPAGVGLARDPQIFLKPGDVVESGIDGLGTATQHVKAYAEN
ncbi:MAG: fumarylacetoacetate hydrolase family protein [Chitinophagaceae bacterium]